MEDMRYENTHTALHFLGMCFLSIGAVKQIDRYTAGQTQITAISLPGWSLGSVAVL